MDDQRIDKIANELMAKAVTRATIKSILKKMNLLDKVDITGRDVEFWPERFTESDERKDWHEGDRLADRASSAFAKALGNATITSNGSYYRVRWKGETLDMGDFNDRGSRWHY
jgi:hypothetical protein